MRGQNGPDEEIRGPEEFQAFAERIRKAFPDAEIAIEDIFAADDKVAIRWVAKGKHAGDGFGTPSGNRIRVSGMTICADCER